MKEKNDITISSDFSVFPYPRVVRIEPSSLCNLKCIHCPTGMKRGVQRGNMSKKVFNRIMEELKTYGGVDVVVLYHGGEPFLNQNIFEMIKVLKAMCIRYVKSVTNGMLINDEMIFKIIKSGLDSIEFSLDGLNPEENDQIRRGSNYTQVVSTVKKLIVMKNEFASATPDIYIANTQIPTEADVKKGIGVSTPKHIMDDFSEFKGSIAFKNTYMIKWIGFDCLDNYKLVESPLIKTKQPANYCDHLIQIITFRWNGDVVPCCYDIVGDYIVGNIMEHSLSEIWNNEKYRRLRRSVYLREYLPLCEHCREIKPHLIVAKNNL